MTQPPHRPSSATAVAAVLAAAVCFGTTGTARALGAPDASALSVGAARILIGGLALALLAWFGRWRRLGTWGPSAAAGRARALSHSTATPSSAGADARAGADAEAQAQAQAQATSLLPPNAVASSALTRARAAFAIVLAACGVMGYQWAFFAGTKANGVAIGTLIALGSAPIITGLAAWALGHGFPGRRWLLATAAAIVGVALLAGLGGLTVIHLSLPGVAASLAAGAGYAASTLASKVLLDGGWSPAGAMGAVYGAAALASALLLPTTDLSWLATSSGLASAVWLGLVATTLAYTLFARGLARLPAALVSSLTLAEPLVASLLGVLVLHERIAAGQLLGALVLLGGLALLVLPMRAPFLRRRSG